MHNALPYVQRRVDGCGRGLVFSATVLIALSHSYTASYALHQPWRILLRYIPPFDREAAGSKPIVTDVLGSASDPKSPAPVLSPSVVSATERQ